jgi:hypothetical protein
MREQSLGSVITGAIVGVGVGAVILVCITPARAQAPEGSAIAAAERVNDFGTPCVMRLASKEL